MSRCGKRAQSSRGTMRIEVALDLHRVLLLRQPEALGKTADMGVDDDALGGSTL